MRTRSRPVTACSTSTLDAVELVRRVRALSPHIGARVGAARPAGDGLACTRGRGRSLRAARGSAGRWEADGRRRLAARPAVRASAISPARAAAFDVIRRVFEQEAYADRALRTAVGRPRRPRPGARAPARIRDRAAGANARPRDRDGGPALRQEARRARPCGAATRCVSARVPRRCSPLRGRQRVRRAGAAIAARAGRAVHERRPAAPRRRGQDVRRGPAGGDVEGRGADALLPRLGRRDVVARPRRGGGAGADAGPERGAADPSFASLRGEIEGRPDADVPGAWHVDHMDDRMFEEGRVWPQSVGSQLAGLCVDSRAGERVLDLCAAPGGKATMLAGEVVAVEANASRARELEENVRRLGATNVTRRLRRRPRSPGRPRPASIARSSTPRAPGSASSPRGPTSAGAPSRCPSCSSSCSGRRRAGAPRRHDRLLRLHRQPGRGRGRRRRSGSRGRPDARRGVAAVPPRRRDPSSSRRCRTSTRTSGFFIARLRVP